MNTVLLLFLIICEIVFASLSIYKKADKKIWNKSRIIVATAELLLFVIMLLLPGIDLGMRFKLLFILLIWRIIWAGIIALCFLKKADGKKKVWAIVLHAILSSILFLMSLFPSFVFADYKGIGTTGNYEVATAKAILVDTTREEEFEQDGSFREVPVYLYYPGNANSGEKFPVVFFSHGAFGYYESNTSTYYELVSNGYVVVSVEHPYHSLYTHDTNGKLITVDPQFMNDSLKIGNSDGDVPEREIVDITSKWLSLRVDDMNFAIDTFKSCGNGTGITDETGTKIEWVTNQENEMNEVLSMCDFDKIGMMGHSLGGATSVELGRIRNDIDAVVDFDGTMIGEIIDVEEDGIHDIIREEEFTVPILSFDNQEHHDERVKCEENGEKYANNVLLSNAREGFSTYIANTGHMNYTDLPLFSPKLASMLGTGTVDAKECVKKMNEITLQFMNCYLKDKGDFSVNECYELSES